MCSASAAKEKRYDLKLSKAQANFRLNSKLTSVRDKKILETKPKVSLLLRGVAEA